MSQNNSVNLPPDDNSASMLRRVEDKVFIEKINILYENLPISCIATLICASVIFFGLSHTTPLKVWYGTVIIITLFRFCFYAVYNLSRPRLKPLLVYYIVGSTLSAACWGTVDSILIPANDRISQMIILIVIAGVSAGSIQTLQTSLAATLLFLGFTIIPLCIWLFLQPGIEYLILGVAMCTYFVFVSISSVRANLMLTQSLKLRLDNLALIRELLESNKIQKQKNSLMKQHEHDVNIINNMSKALQLCQNSFEAYSAIKISAEKLFIGSNGGLTISDKLDNQHLVAQWGETNILQTDFSSNDCWALRSGTQHTVKDNKLGLVCHHYTMSSEGRNICIPLMMPNDVLGMLHFNIPKTVIFTKDMKQNMSFFAETIKLALAKVKLQEKLQREASHDPLTTLYNRRYLNEALAREMQHIIQNNSTLCIALLDLDHFKNFNDLYGHEAGDEVLKQVSKLLISKIRERDLACRFGGEEFVLVFIHTDIHNVLPYLESIREEIKNMKVYFHDTLLQPITVSIGIAEAPKDGISAIDLIQAADMAMYAAKQAGRDTVMIAQPTNAIEDQAG